MDTRIGTGPIRESATVTPDRPHAGDSMSFRTIAIHAGYDPRQHLGAVMPPSCRTSTFAFRGVNQPGPFDYSRTGNPARTALA
jgi:cystathionine beta-lyase/cystathionine gamma-synthase